MLRAQVGIGWAALTIAGLICGGGCRRSEPESAPFATAAPALTPDEIAGADRAAAEEVERWTRERDEQLREAIDPGELAEHTRRIGQADIAAGRVPLADLFLQGEAIFDRDFTRREGLGHGMGPLPAPGLSRVEHRAALGGPDALSCRECHGRGGDDGHGELHQRAWLDGDGRHLGSAHPRVPPHLAGLGLIQALAAEMTAELAGLVEQQRVVVRHGVADRRVPLVSKGVSFGEALIRPDGSLDTSGVRGIDLDRVVRPLGWKGVQPSLRTFIRSALPQHMGLEPLVLPSPAGATPALATAGPSMFAAIEARSGIYDRDGDGVPGELTEGQITSLSAYLALLDVPVILPPRGAETYAAWSRGGGLFRTLGCASCHRPELPLRSAVWVERGAHGGEGLRLDLVRDVQVRPGPDHFDDTAPDLAVRLFSDLRRHDLGPALAERKEGGAGPREFLTRPLWGLGDRGPYYLHDGRARSLGEAIRLHAGEAAAAAASYNALSDGEARSLDVFLLSLRRAPQARIAP
ncbi:MAG: hypothetical protein EXR72_19205 [Myxococcales bacterium]|nr:hypothetical protein [Myxococcales bacterium]